MHLWRSHPEGISGFQRRAMRQNQWVVAIVVVALLGAIWIRFHAQIVAALFPPPPPAVALENFKCLFSGMTLEEAHDILGRPSALEGGRLDMWWNDEFSIQLHSTDGVVNGGYLIIRKNEQKIEIPTLGERYLLDGNYIAFSVLVLL